MGAELQVRHPIQTVESIRLAELICRRGDSNPHELPHTPLKRARLPVPPLRLRLSDNDETLECCPTCQSISRLKKRQAKDSAYLFLLSGDFLTSGLAAGEAVCAAGLV